TAGGSPQSGVRRQNPGDPARRIVVLPPKRSLPATPGSGATVAIRPSGTMQGQFHGVLQQRTMDGTETSAAMAAVPTKALATAGGSPQSGVRRQNPGDPARRIVVLPPKRSLPATPGSGATVAIRPSGTMQGQFHGVLQQRTMDGTETSAAMAAVPTKALAGPIRHVLLPAGTAFPPPSTVQRAAGAGDLLDPSLLRPSNRRASVGLVTPGTRLPQAIVPVLPSLAQQERDERKKKEREKGRSTEKSVKRTCTQGAGGHRQIGSYGRGYNPPFSPDRIRELETRAFGVRCPPFANRPSSSRTEMSFDESKEEPFALDEGPIEVKDEPIEAMEEHEVKI
ncbi:hypothetical protein PENTCL1PPCAC_9672, partial [Pristionchus entomophagus]